MTKYTQLPLVEVSKDDNQIVCYFIDKANGIALDVKFRLKKYDQKKQKFVDDETQYQRTVNSLQEYFGVGIDNIEDAIGQEHDVFAYDNYNALWESDKKFDTDMAGQILQGTIKDVFDTDTGIVIKLDYDGDTYRSNMKFTEKVGDEFYIKPQKKKRQLDAFVNKFGMPVEDGKKLIGTDVHFEVKAIGPNTWIDIKPLPKKK